MYKSVVAIGARLLLPILLMLSPFSVADEIWIDVRTPVEHLIDSIEGDPLIPHTDIVEEVSQLYPDKSAKLYLYCRSGNRAGSATLALQEAGYRNVTNAGGIDDARRERGLNE